MVGVMVGVDPTPSCRVASLHAQGAGRSPGTYRGGHEEAAMKAPRSRNDAAGSSPEPVYRISAAGRSLSDDIDTRTRRYLISMGIRTLSFIGCVVAFVVFDQPIIGWILFVAALILPYIAVVVANAGREPGRPLPSATLMDGSTELGSGTSERTDESGSSGPTNP